MLALFDIKSSNHGGYVARNYLLFLVAQYSKMYYILYIMMVNSTIYAMYCPSDFSMSNNSIEDIVLFFCHINIKKY